jgi:transposase, IS5 family
LSLCRTNSDSPSSDLPASPGPARPFDLFGQAAEDAIYDSDSMRRFVGIELGEDKVPDESSILRFRHLLEEHDLTKTIFTEIGALLEEGGCS